MTEGCGTPAGSREGVAGQLDAVQHRPKRKVVLLPLSLYSLRFNHVKGGMRLESVALSGERAPSRPFRSGHDQVGEGRGAPLRHTAELGALRSGPLHHKPANDRPVLAAQAVLDSFLDGRLLPSPLPRDSSSLDWVSLLIFSAKMKQQSCILHLALFPSREIKESGRGNVGRSHPCDSSPCLRSRRRSDTSGSLPPHALAGVARQTANFCSRAKSFRVISSETVSCVFFAVFQNLRLLTNRGLHSFK